MTRAKLITLAESADRRAVIVHYRGKQYLVVRSEEQVREMVAAGVDFEIVKILNREKNKKNETTIRNSFTTINKGGIMVIKFQTVVEGEKTVVEYSRDGIIVARYETTDALALVVGLMARVQADPHMIFDIQVRITGADLSLSEN
jgi:hypothetical protein